MPLIAKINIARPDDLYAQLLSCHAHLSDEESQTYNARLILILLNHIGDTDVIAEALQLAALNNDSPIESVSNGNS
jgi:hypothetical protein